MPADFIAVSSYFSAKFPNVIIEESNTDIGNANGTSLLMRKKAIEQCLSTLNLYQLNRLCTSIEIALVAEKLLLKVKTKGPIKDLIMS